MASLRETRRFVFSSFSFCFLNIDILYYFLFCFCLKFLLFFNCLIWRRRREEFAFHSRTGGIDSRYDQLGLFAAVTQIFHSWPRRHWMSEPGRELVWPTVGLCLAGRFPSSDTLCSSVSVDCWRVLSASRPLVWPAMSTALRDTCLATDDLKQGIKTKTNQTTIRLHCSIIGNVLADVTNLTCHGHWIVHETIISSVIRSQ